MKIKIQISSVVLLLALAGAAVAGELTAFDLVKEGNRFIGEQSRNKVVQIRSERSAGTLVPNIWYVVYYDPDASLKAIEVKFGAGQKMDVSHPMRLLEPITGAEKVLDPAKLKVDSDRALKIATSQPLLANLNLSSVQMWLKHSEDGPVWKVKIWAAKLNNPSHQTDVGDVFISSADGSVIRVDLHPDKIN